MKLPHRRQFLHLAAGAAALPAVSRIARAQAYPTRPVRIIVGFPAGGAPDIIARLMGQGLSERLGQQFVIENRPGAGSNIGTEMVVKAPPDGYTFLMVVATNTVNATLYTTSNSISFATSRPSRSLPAVLWHGGQSIIPGQNRSRVHRLCQNQSGQDQLRLGRQRSGPHVVGELFKMMTGIDLVHVPYRSGYWPDLLSGQVQVAFAPMLRRQAIQAGTLRALAVTGATRSEAHRISRPSASSSRDMRRSVGMGSARPQIHQRRSSTNSTMRSTWSSLIL